jgi:hypothetical protein
VVAVGQRRSGDVSLAVAERSSGLVTHPGTATHALRTQATPSLAGLRTYRQDSHRGRQRYGLVGRYTLRLVSQSTNLAARGACGI